MNMYVSTEIAAMPAISATPPIQSSTKNPSDIVSSSATAQFAAISDAQQNEHGTTPIGGELAPIGGTLIGKLQGGSLIHTGGLQLSNDGKNDDKDWLKDERVVRHLCRLAKDTALKSLQEKQADTTDSVPEASGGNFCNSIANKA